MYKIFGLASLLLILSMRAEAAQGIRAILGEDSVRFTYVTEAWGQEIGSLDVEAGVLVAGSSNTSGSDSTLIHVGGLVQHQNLDSSLKLSVGVRVYYSSIADQNAALIALGGDLLLSPENWSGLGLGLSYYTAPSVTTFSDADAFTEYSVSFHYQITPQANIFLGFQSVTIKLKNETSDRDLEDGSFLGIKVDF